METGFFKEHGKADSVKNMGNKILKTDRFCKEYESRFFED
jgi:hypothetical protein